jgi:UDP-perosamine 4-acetyltransferase
LKKKIIIIGGNDHAKSILDILSRNDLLNKIYGYADIKKTSIKLNYLGNDKEILNLKKKEEFFLVMGIGINMAKREKIYNKFKNYFKFLTIIDKTAVISPFAKIKNGSVIFPMSYVGPYVNLDENIVIHTGSFVHHDVKIKKNCYIGPGSIICGNSIIKKNTFVGGGSFLREGIKIGENNIIGAGSLVLKNFLKKNKKLFGNPAREIYEKN